MFRNLKRCRRGIAFAWIRLAPPSLRSAHPPILGCLGSNRRYAMKHVLALLIGLSFVPVARAQTVTLHELFGFNCTSTSCPDGKEPDALILASDGNLYGAAEYSNT